MEKLFFRFCGGEDRCMVGRVRDHMENPGVDSRIILKWILKWDGVKYWIVWLRIGTCGGLL
jgi:hypothetical protein